MSLFPDDREVPAEALDTVQVKLSEMELRNPRSFGDCWLGCELWRQLQLDQLWSPRLEPGREAVPWSQVPQLLVVNRLIDPGSEFRLHRHWFDQAAMADLLDVDFGVASKDRLYRCLDHLLAHKQDLFAFLRQRWQDLFHPQFDVLLCDLTSTYLEGEAERIPSAKRGYSRDGRPDCLQLVVASVVTTDGFPLVNEVPYEVMDGDTSDKTTLKGFLSKIESMYGKAERVWVMDRGIPTEAVLKEMCEADPPVRYLVGTPRAKMRKMGQQWLELPWRKVRDSVSVELAAEGGEMYVLAKKEMAMRRKKLARLLWKLRAMRRSCPARDQLLLRIGAAKSAAGRAFGFLEIQLPSAKQAVTRETFTFRVCKEKLREAELVDGRHLLIFRARIRWEKTRRCCGSATSS